MRTLRNILTSIVFITAVSSTVNASTVEDVTVMNTKEVNMVFRVRTVITKLKHYDNST